MEVNDKIKKWVKEAIDKGYTKDEILLVLDENNFSADESELILKMFDESQKGFAFSKTDFSKKLEIDKLKKIIAGSAFKKEETVEKEVVRSVSEKLALARKEIGKAVIGQQETIDSLFTSLLCDGHVLLEGVPGIAKTLLIKTLSEVSGCESKRIQFTADLLPSDIIGLTSYVPKKGFEVVKGPVFANFIIADEINRSPPKTQSALMEAMQEKQVTIGRENYPLPLPFFVMATDNPLENSGVYTLPEAQVDRFLFKLIMGYPNNSEELEVMESNATHKKFSEFGVNPILSPQEIINMHKITQRIYVDRKIKEYILNIVSLTRTKDFNYGEFIDWGASPRASIGLYNASKARALVNGRNYVIPKDVRDIAHAVLRHRIILNYRAQAEGIDSDKIISTILKERGI